MYTQKLKLIEVPLEAVQLLELDEEVNIDVMCIKSDNNKKYSYSWEKEWKKKKSDVGHNLCNYCIEHFHEDNQGIYSCTVKDSESLSEVVTTELILGKLHVDVTICVLS